MMSRIKQGDRIEELGSVPANTEPSEKGDKGYMFEDLKEAHWALVG